MEEKRCDLCGELYKKGEHGWLKMGDIIESPSGLLYNANKVYRHSEGLCSKINDDCCAISDAAYKFDK